MNNRPKNLFLSGIDRLKPSLLLNDNGIPEGKVEKIAWILLKLHGSGCGCCNANGDEVCGEDWKECVNGVADFIRKAVLEENEIEIYENGWIACKEGLPEEYGSYLVAWKYLDMTKDQMIKMWGYVVPHFCEIMEYDPDDDKKWIGDIKQAHGEYEIIAWQPLPGYYHPYQHKNV